jgi:Berberine and berberine like
MGISNHVSVINFNMRWSNPSDNVELRRLFILLIERAKDAAKVHGAYHRFIFQNHAFEEEDVFGSYGRENLRRLREIRQKVDPEGVFQILQPGYFKLGVGTSPGDEHSRTVQVIRSIENPMLKTEL